ncbi:hypothetical protein [Mucisphaera calidilacus]|uniref:Type II secretion system protein GspC N-terminal domain-containing protein n=1 Tax=Mucisphaera calidilacus TaxID=2527982 RepID=A0A518BUE2_9BACT|nr:hypothetical protein [Mucisphaera calidilacus]QDU70613.1 hypothetical protein Pan265_04410 [Mucisphaera calidilacus]
MNLRQRKNAMAGLAGCIAAAGVVVLILAFTLTIERPQTDVDLTDAETGAAGSASQPTTITRAGPTLNALRQAAALDLRRPLYDPSPPPQVQRPTTTQLPVELVATIDDADASVAILRKRDGTTEIALAGESITTPNGTITVTAVKQRSVEISFRNASHTLTLPVEPGGTP